MALAPPLCQRPALEVRRRQRIAEMIKRRRIRRHRHSGRRRDAVGARGILTGDIRIHRAVAGFNGMKSEGIIQKSHSQSFRPSLRSTGVEVVVIEFADI